MTIKYVWENMEVNVPNDNGIYPHTHKEIKTVEYEFDTRVKTSDIVDYLMPYNLKQKNKTTEQEKEVGLANYYMTKAIGFMRENLNLDLDDLESDEYFVEFMRERYQELALEEWQERNEEY